MKRFLRKLGGYVAPFRGLMSFSEHRRVARMPAMTEGRARLLGHDVLFSDKNGFLHSVEEIFRDQVYRFAAAGPRPVIVDAGANSGLSVLYFKCLHPDCRIVAFEPDPEIFRLLERNVRAWRLGDVELRNAAAWTADEPLTFFVEGSLAGSALADHAGEGRRVTVKAERLKRLLQERDVDFLKLDIEGAENRVLPDIAPELHRVRALFFEYHSVAGQPQELDRLLRVVSEAGFRYVVKGAMAPQLPFIERGAAAFDMQLNVFCRRD